MKNSTGIATIMAAVLAASALGGCGGGGSLTPAPPPATSFDLRTGITGLVANGQSASVTDPQNNLIETDVTNYSLTDSGVLSFMSATAQSSAVTLTVTAQ